MSTLTSVGPMIINGGMPQPVQPGMPMMASNAALTAQYLNGNGSPFGQMTAYRSSVGSVSGSSSSSTTSNNNNNAAINRSQRCGVCRGCQCKPCGQCTYCQDSPQFGGPGVKKQSCIERRCLRVLENRLQREAPSFKARVGCNNCDDCRLPDCQGCLVCLDKRFFENRYMTGALCAKKRCNNATSIELPSHQQSQQPSNGERQMMKRSFEATGQNYDYIMSKRRHEMAPQGVPVQAPNGLSVQQRVMAMPPNMSNGAMVDSNGYPQHPGLQAIRIVPHQQMMPPQNGQMSLLMPMTSMPNNDNNNQPSQPNGETNGHANQVAVNGNNGNPAVNGQHPMTIQHAPPHHSQQPQQQAPPPPPQQNYPQYMQPDMMTFQNGGMQPQFYHQNTKAAFIAYPKCEPKYEYYDCEMNRSPHQDPYLPPSYSGESKNGIVLQPL
uniref:CXXC-type domain-containing protein n=1 Tax=Panagrellus redivivus TaxID=6233 RepID=A0A7E4WA21_PANRE